MNMSTRIAVWKILEEYFNALWVTMKDKVPDCKMASYRSSNDKFILRGGVEISNDDKDLTLSFDVFLNEDSALVRGDIDFSKTALVEVLEKQIPLNDIDHGVVSLAQDYGRICLSNALGMSKFFNG